MDNVHNGPFTCLNKNDPANKNNKSLMDYVIVSKELVQLIKHLEIDNKLEWTFSRPHKEGLKYLDHYVLFLTMGGIPTKTKQ